MPAFATPHAALGLPALAYLAGLYYTLRGLARAGSRSTAGAARRVAELGLMAALAALLQAAPVFWPGLGLALATCASLPVTAGALLHPRGALPMTLAATAVLLLIHPEEALVFALATAPVGLGAAWSTLTRPRPLLRWLWPGLLLAAGLLCLTYGIGLAALGPAVAGLGVVAAAVYVGFALAWGALWAGVGAGLHRLLGRLLASEARGTRDAPPA